MVNAGFQALLALSVHLIFFIITWWALQSIKFERLFRRPGSLQARVAYLLIVIAVSYPVASFFQTYLNLSLALPQIYR
ncbi:MAG: DUF1146 family protein [Sporolactobacillus sp.]